MEHMQPPPKCDICGRPLTKVVKYVKLSVGPIAWLCLDCCQRMDVKKGQGIPYFKMLGEWRPGNDAKV